jgi:hypothetical protein
MLNIQIIVSLFFLLNFLFNRKCLLRHIGSSDFNDTIILNILYINANYF